MRWRYGDRRKGLGQGVRPGPRAAALLRRRAGGWALIGALLVAAGLAGLRCTSESDRERLERATKDMVAADTPEQFERHVLAAGTVVVVDFHATWCPPCRVLSPVLGRLATEYKGRAKFVKVDVDRAEQLARDYRVRSVPTVLLVVDGRETARWRGIQKESTYRKAVEAALAGRGPGRRERNGS